MSVRVETAGGTGTPEGGRQAAARVAGADHPAGRGARARARGASRLELDALEWQPLHPRAFRRALKPAMLIALATTAPLVGLARLARARRAAVHAGVAGRRDVEAGAAHAVGRHRRRDRVPQRLVVAACHGGAGGEDSGGRLRRVAVRSARRDGQPAGGHGGRPHPLTISIPYLARETARALYERLATQTAQTAFRW